MKEFGYTMHYIVEELFRDPVYYNVLMVMYRVIADEQQREQKKLKSRNRGR